MFRFKDVSIRIQRESTIQPGLVFDFLVYLEGGFDPGYPPPPCSNHDDPRFSDPGSPGDCEIYGVTKIEDLCFDEDLLTGDDRRLYEAIEGTCHKGFMEWSPLSKQLNRRISGWLEELLLARHRVTIELTREEELRHMDDIVDQAAQEMENYRQDALVDRAEID